MSFEPNRVVNLKQVEFILDELKCKICDCILECPVSCKECQNHFCWKCIRQWLETPGSNRKCPSCRGVWKEREGGLLMKRLLSKLEFKCQAAERGCQEILAYDELTQHETRTCKFALRFCPFGCKQKVLTKDIQAHKLVCDSIEKYALRMRRRTNSGSSSTSSNDNSFTVQSNPDFNPFNNLKCLRQLGYAWETHLTMDQCKNAQIDFNGMGWKKIVNFVQALSGLAPDEQFNRLKGKGDFEQYGILGWTHALEVEQASLKLDKCAICSKKLSDVIKLFKERIDYLIMFEEDELEEFSDDEVQNQADYNYMVLNQMIGSLGTTPTSKKKVAKQLNEDAFLKDNLAIIRESGSYWVEHLSKCENKKVKIDITGWELLEDFALGLKGTASNQWFLDLSRENDNMICWREILLSDETDNELARCKVCLQTRDKIATLFKTRIDRLLSLEHQMPKCDEILEQL